MISYLVICLCADWCGVCREYRPVFDSLALKFPNVQFSWIDIEDKAEWVDPIEVENFPTILITKGKQPLFFGTMLPHLETLERLIQDKITHDEVRSIKDNAVVQLAARIYKNFSGECFSNDS
jgi:thiol-disulfide isomerase/thioredoxin